MSVRVVSSKGDKPISPHGLLMSLHSHSGSDRATQSPLSPNRLLSAEFAINVWAAGQANLAAML